MQRRSKLIPTRHAPTLSGTNRQFSKLALGFVLLICMFVAAEVLPNTVVGQHTLDQIARYPLHQLQASGYYKDCPACKGYGYYFHTRSYLFLEKCICINQPWLEQG